MAPCGLISINCKHSRLIQLNNILNKYPFYNEKRIIIIGVIVVLIVAIAVKLASNKKTIDDKKKPVLESNVSIPVNTVIVGLQDVNNQLVKTGNLVPFKEADIMAISSGKLIAVNSTWALW